MKNYQYILFDLDGTLLDSSPGIRTSFDHTTQTLGLPDLTEDQFFTCLGPPVRHSFQTIYSLEGNELEQAVDLFRDRYLTIDMFNAMVYPGMADLLSNLKASDRKIGVATYKKLPAAIDVLRHFDLLHYFDEVHGADQQGKWTKLDIINQCLDALGAAEPTPRKTAVMIGDTKYDAEGAVRAGLDFIRVSYGYGFRTPEDLQALKAVGQADDVPELAKLLLI